MIKTEFAKKASAFALIVPLVTMGGCGSLPAKDMATVFGGVIGYAATGLLTKNPNARLLGGAAGAGFGRMLAPDCDTENTTSLGRNINGEQSSEWQGSQSYREKCSGSGSNDLPGANLPTSVFVK